MQESMQILSFINSLNDQINREENYLFSWKKKDDRLKEMTTTAFKELFGKIEGALCRTENLDRFLKEVTLPLNEAFNRYKNNITNVKIGELTEKYLFMPDGESRLSVDLLFVSPSVLAFSCFIEHKGSTFMITRIEFSEGMKAEVPYRSWYRCASLNDKVIFEILFRREKRVVTEKVSMKNQKFNITLLSPSEIYFETTRN